MLPSPEIYDEPVLAIVLQRFQAQNGITCQA